MTVIGPGKYNSFVRIASCQYLEYEDRLHSLVFWETGTGVGSISQGWSMEIFFWDKYSKNSRLSSWAIKYKVLLGYVINLRAPASQLSHMLPEIFV
jgi:hypothetical protein